jgi:hypothetical protein
MNKILHIGFNWGGIAQTKQMRDLIQQPHLVYTWMNYGGNCWIIHTPYDQNYWADFLGPHLGTSNSVIILEIQNLGNANGWLPKDKWDWFYNFR